jgi:hypothetical protein
VRLPAALVCLGLAGCGGAAQTHDDARAGQTISGSIAGISWPGYASAYWIGKPSAGSPPVILFLLEAATPCAAISTFNWDKFIGTERVLEIALDDAAAAPRTFAVPAQASVAYLRGAYNPDADAGSVTVTSLTPGGSLAGSFDARFGADRLAGSFQAAPCAAGVEP